MRWQRGDGGAAAEERQVTGRGQAGRLCARTTRWGGATTRRGCAGGYMSGAHRWTPGCVGTSPALAMPQDARLAKRAGVLAMRRPGVGSKTDVADLVLRPAVLLTLLLSPASLLSRHILRPARARKCVLTAHAAAGTRRVCGVCDVAAKKPSLT